MAGLYDDVKGGEVKGTMNPWSYPRRAMGSNVYGGSAGGAGYYGSSAGGGTAMRNPWGAATGMGGAQQGYSMGGQVPQGGQMGQEQGANPWTQSQSWSAQNPQKPAYDLNAAKRMAYLKGNVGGKGNAEYDYLSALKGQTPGFQQAAPTSQGDMIAQNLQMLPQLQQYVSQLKDIPGRQSKDVLWDRMMMAAMSGKDLSKYLSGYGAQGAGSYGGPGGLWGGI